MISPLDIAQHENGNEYVVVDNDNGSGICSKCVLKVYDIRSHLIYTHGLDPLKKQRRRWVIFEYVLIVKINCVVVTRALSSYYSQLIFINFPFCMCAS